MTPRLPTPCLALALALALPVRADEASPYGINVHQAATPVLDQVQAAGIGWIRVDFNWLELEPQRGQFDWSVADRLVQDAQARGLAVFATLAYAPGWANGGQHHSYPALDPADWGRFVSAVVTRYRGRVRHWGMWNEPNLDHFFRGSAQTYVRDILAVGAQAAKAADPGCQVLGPDLAHLQGAHWDRWLRDILRGGAQHFDIITHHMYKEPDSLLASMDGFVWFWDGGNVKSVIERNGGRGKPVWLTECGWTVRDKGEQGQADRYLRLLDGLARRPWIQKVFFYEIADDPSISDDWGILRPDLSRKPAFEAYRGWIATHPGPGPLPPPTPLPPPAPSPVPPPPQPAPGAWTFEAERDLNHIVGRAEAEGWSATTALDPPGHLAYGPYTTGVTPGPRVASFRILIDVVAGNDRVLTLDAYDAAASRVLARREVRRSELRAPMTWQELELPFTAAAGQRLELRVYWHDTAYTRLDRVTVR